MAPQIRLIKPLRYLELLRLLLDACAVFTDSGGMQKEAYFCQCPCITLFHNTSWPETLENGWNRLVDSDKNKILEFNKPKIKSAIYFLEHSGEKVVLTSLNKLEDSLKGNSGTTITKD